MRTVIVCCNNEDGIGDLRAGLAYFTFLKEQDPSNEVKLIVSIEKGKASLIRKLLPEWLGVIKQKIEVGNISRDKAIKSNTAKQRIFDNNDMIIIGPSEGMDDIGPYYSSNNHVALAFKAFRLIVEPWLKTDIGNGILINIGMPLTRGTWLLFQEIHGVPKFSFTEYGPMGFEINISPVKIHPNYTTQFSNIVGQVETTNSVTTGFESTTGFLPSIGNGINVIPHLPGGIRVFNTPTINNSFVSKDSSIAIGYIQHHPFAFLLHTINAAKANKKSKCVVFMNENILAKYDVDRILKIFSNHYKMKIQKGSYDKKTRKIKGKDKSGITIVPYSGLPEKDMQDILNDPNNICIGGSGDTSISEMLSRTSMPFFDQTPWMRLLNKSFLGYIHTSNLKNKDILFKYFSEMIQIQKIEDDFKSSKDIKYIAKLCKSYDVLFDIMQNPNMKQALIELNHDIKNNFNAYDTLLLLIHTSRFCHGDNFTKNDFSRPLLEQIRESPKSTKIIAEILTQYFIQDLENSRGATIDHIIYFINVCLSEENQNINLNWMESQKIRSVMDHVIGFLIHLEGYLPQIKSWENIEQWRDYMNQVKVWNNIKLEGKKPDFIYNWLEYYNINNTKRGFLEHLLLKEGVSNENISKLPKSLSSYALLFLTDDILKFLGIDDKKQCVLILEIIKNATNKTNSMFNNKFTANEKDYYCLLEVLLKEKINSKPKSIVHGLMKKLDKLPASYCLYVNEQDLIYLGYSDPKSRRELLSSLKDLKNECSKTFNLYLKEMAKDQRKELTEFIKKTRNTTSSTLNEQNTGLINSKTSLNELSLFKDKGNYTVISSGSEEWIDKIHNQLSKLIIPNELKKMTLNYMSNNDKKIFKEILNEIRKDTIDQLEGYDESKGSLLKLLLIIKNKKDISLKSEFSPRSIEGVYKPR